MNSLVSHLCNMNGSSRPGDARKLEVQLEVRRLAALPPPLGTEALDRPITPSRPVDGSRRGAGSAKRGARPPPHLSCVQASVAGTTAPPRPFEAM